MKSTFQSEIKWTFYCIIGAVLLSLVYSILNEILSNFIQKPLFIVLPSNTILFVFCVYKCISERKTEHELGFIARIRTVLNMFILYSFFLSLVLLNTENLIPKLETEIIEEEENFAGI